jgi:hypothetical protein
MERGDHANLLAHPEYLVLGPEGPAEGRTYVAEAEGSLVGFATWIEAGGVFELEDRCQAGGFDVHSWPLKQVADVVQAFDVRQRGGRAVAADRPPVIVLAKMHGHRLPRGCAVRWRREAIVPPPGRPVAVRWPGVPLTHSARPRGSARPAWPGSVRRLCRYNQDLPAAGPNDR